ncbi:hypothetical protein ASPFODRAFT_287072 [Aspergillus luchuensis CBS 106.47]|uniref:Uncharacterized protein n=1 Tax=Aspergillus luchuensis (strain CBS 106.47) TaxID=1137211 RepID=A0A1M3TAI3_ASPLC|nr:hypothetical protein ASPFODRAFT_287072 [Aspergillus luchuensis CBS 106.47]
MQASVRWRFKLGPPISLVLLVQNMHAGSAAFLRITIVDPLSLNSWVSLVWPIYHFHFPFSAICIFYVFIFFPLSFPFSIFICFRFFYYGSQI